jgi:dolichol-phosphate mannosyltransferase
MITVVLPAYNEAENIILLIERIQKIAKRRLLEGIKIIVVDDGSSDEMVVKVQKIADENVLLVKHGQNKGLGEAIKTGILTALDVSENEDVIVTMDSDNTHSPGLLMRMIMAIDEGNDVVIASRYQPGARVIGVSLFRQTLSLGMSWIFRLLVPIAGVKDYSCGYRAYRTEILKKAFQFWGEQFINQSGFSCMVDILLKLNRLESIMSEVPIILRYDYKKGKSKMNIVKTIRETLAIAFREVARH